jgi:UDP-N-acetylbacillosamine N-acetyltransferase
MDNSVIIIGAFIETIEFIEKCGLKIDGIIDPNKSFSNLKYIILGDDDYLVENHEKYRESKLVLSPDLPKVRKKLFTLYNDLNFGFATAIAPTATISASAKIGEGAILQHGVNISSNVKIGDHVRINVNANVMHDSKVGRFSTIAPNAVILGNVMIGDETYIGANAVILPGITIGNNCVIGAGSVVTKNVKDNMVVKGNPAK